MTYPEAVKIGGAEYDLNTGYEYALACFRCINDLDISDAERALGVIGLLYKDTPPEEHMQEALRLAVKYLQCGKDARPIYRKRDMDFEADATYIKASFLSDYKIDLDETNLHWWKFCALLQGLTDDCILNRVRDLRNYDLSSVKDSKARSRIAEAQKDVALPERISAEDQAVADEFFAQLED